MPIAINGSGTVTGISVGGLPNDVSSLTADHWRLTTEFSGDQDPITNAVERVDTAGQGYIGSAMTVSSGIWTFPLTGIWQVSFHSEHSHSSLADRNVQSWIKVTTNNGSDWTEIAKSSIQATNDSSVAGNHNDVSTLIDVTDVGQVKVAFKVDTINSSTETKASSTYNRTSFTFIRLGAT